MLWDLVRRMLPGEPLAVPTPCSACVCGHTAGMAGQARAVAMGFARIVAGGRWQNPGPGYRLQRCLPMTERS
jgi:hypothetical protein